MPNILATVTDCGKQMLLKILIYFSPIMVITSYISLEMNTAIHFTFVLI